ncbi:MAG: flagellar biosynthesis protein FliQ [Alphaproteobacteria bacterium]|nr:flagellar biosynthesis protein FliQ [Alphaproteobacteria bacterium]
MEPTEIIDIGRDAIYVLIVIASPVMLTSLIVGLIVSLFQALTQIQEQTLTFVPKILTMLVVLGFTMPFMLQHLTDFTHRLTEKIVHIE